MQPACYKFSLFIAQKLAARAAALLAATVILLALLCPARAESLANISTARLAGQMVLIGFKASNKNDFVVKKLGQEASLGKLGGVVFSAQNFSDLPTTRSLIERFANIAVANPLLLILDPAELGGAWEHLGGLNAEDIALSSAKLDYLKHSLEIFRLGFDALFLPPLASLDGEAQGRSSAYAQLRSESAAAAGLARAVAEFPGSDKQRFFLSYLRSFYDQIITQAPEIIIASNKIFPELDPERPIAQSPRALGILREQLGFSGLIASADILGGDLDSQEFSARIISSINAGCDLLFFGQSMIKGGDTASVVSAIITDAVAAGRISRERLEESYRRITAFKSALKPHLHEEN